METKQLINYKTKKMSRTEVRNSVNWVYEFGIDGANGNSDKLHYELSRLEN